MVKKALSQVSVNHSSGNLVKLYATGLNLVYRKYSFALENLWLLHNLMGLKIFEPVREISNNVICATSKASDQPAHTRSLIRAFASRLSIL